MAAILAAVQAPDRVRSLLLCEPACVSVARGCDRVEQHITSLAPVFELAADTTISDDRFALLFVRHFSEAVGAPPSEVPLAALREQGRRLRMSVPPWQVPVPATIARVTPTLVVTGGRGDMYDEIAAPLTEHGGQHLVVNGFGHRPQDDPQAMEWMTIFWTAHDQP
jgi:pimeloyl-ACP methyl ester carboxylesterase